MLKLSTRALFNLGAAAAALTAAPAFAQEAAPAAQEAQSTAGDFDIVVTARRREENLLDVPVAITAYSGDALARQGALDLTAISDTTPNVTFETSRGTNSTLTAFIRGVGQQDPVAGFEAGVGLYLDDVYLNRPQAAVLDIYNVERIEVLRGPQGTLYGRNTIGGAIKYVTKALNPDDAELGIRANVGEYNQLDVIATGSLPLNQDLRIGASVARLGRDGFGKNLTTGQENYNKDIWAARATIEAGSHDSVFFRLSGDYTRDTSNPRGGHRLIPGLISGTPVLTDVFDSRGNLVTPTQDVKSYGVAGRGKTATGRLWVYAADDQASGSTAPRATWYRFTPDRTAAHPLSHLAGFRNFLQADAYAGYDGLYRGGVTEVACWAHFRRKVFDLHERSPTPLTTDILERIGTLYAVEAEVRGQPPDVRWRARQEKSRPLVDALREVLDASLRRLSSRSDMARAIAYGTKRWLALSRFLGDGRLEIDNNIAERALRGVAVGRRNWLFAGSRAGGERAAAIYTIIQTCKANGVDPPAYIADVIAKVAGDWPASRWDELMPWNWSPEPARLAA